MLTPSPENHTPHPAAGNGGRSWGRGFHRQRRHLELGVEGAPEQVEQAMVDIRREIEQRGITWRWRDQAGSDSL